MDGYAVATSDLTGPWRVIGESAAGHPYTGTFGIGEAVRISTGALLPEGAGAVVLQEDATRDGDTIALTGDGPSPPARHIRRKAMDFDLGTELLPAGTRLGPAQIGLAIAAGHAEVAVRRRPRVVLIDGGDELVAPGQPCAPHQLPASNSAMLAALFAGETPDVRRIGPVPDRLDALVDALAAADHADLVVTVGGASVGDHDLVRPALERWGARIDFWKIAIKPGKPLLVATRGRTLVVGLPGNPASSLVTATLFVQPLLRALQGARECLPRRIGAVLADPVPAGGTRQEFLRAVWDGETIASGTLHDSGALASLAASNALIDRPAGAPAAEAGARVDAILLETG
jgi:molybdopterin molybdotransferase